MAPKRASNARGQGDAPKKSRRTSKKDDLRQLADEAAEESEKQKQNRELSAMTAKLRYQASAACKKAYIIFPCSHSTNLDSPCAFIVRLAYTRLYKDLLCPMKQKVTGT